MRTRHIEVFNAIYTLGSVSAAARFLHITQPTVSKMLKNLEADLGYSVFFRKDGKLYPTPEADRIYAKTKEINKQINELNSLTSNLADGGTDKIRLATIPAVGLEFLPRHIHDHVTKYPELQFELQLHQSHEVVRALFEHEKDIGIVFDNETISGTQTISLCTGEYVCVGAPGSLPNKPTLDFVDLAELKLISMENSGPLENSLPAELKKVLNKANNASITAQTYLAAKNLAVLGHGVAIMDEFSAHTSTLGQVDIKPFTQSVKFQLSAIYLEQYSLSVNSKKFLTSLKAFLQEFTSAN